MLHPPLCSKEAASPSLVVSKQTKLLIVKSFLFIFRKTRLSSVFDVRFFCLWWGHHIHWTHTQSMPLMRVHGLDPKPMKPGKDIGSRIGSRMPQLNHHRCCSGSPSRKLPSELVSQQMTPVADRLDLFSSPETWSASVVEDVLKFCLCLLAPAAVAQMKWWAVLVLEMWQLNSPCNTEHRHKTHKSIVVCNN